MISCIFYIANKTSHRRVGAVAPTYTGVHPEQPLVLDALEQLSEVARGAGAGAVGAQFRPEDLHHRVPALAVRPGAGLHPPSSQHSHSVNQEFQVNKKYNLVIGQRFHSSGTVCDEGRFLGLAVNAAGLLVPLQRPAAALALPAGQKTIFVASLFGLVCAVWGDLQERAREWQEGRSSSRPDQLAGVCSTVPHN